MGQSCCADCARQDADLQAARTPRLTDASGARCGASNQELPQVARTGQAFHVTQAPVERNGSQQVREAPRRLRPLCMTCFAVAAPRWTRARAR